MPSSQYINKSAPQYSGSRIHEHTCDDEAASSMYCSQNPFGILSNLFGGNMPDAERIILVALMIILARDGADLTLLLALGYLLI